MGVDQVAVDLVTESRSLPTNLLPPSDVISSMWATSQSTRATNIPAHARLTIPNRREFSLFNKHAKIRRTRRKMGEWTPVRNLYYADSDSAGFQMSLSRNKVFLQMGVVHSCNLDSSRTLG
ncbi:hypothetical protein CSKR_107777 [Clonorchis sinensis]|uniref:Uncharacterized protein n=1 Tax=Clonorchis sinensis TaxID=79923 RepID=A0A419PVI7_CLOSI|nr:hypothetical protein CSKR_107777 [Clonorchis sinensis]